MELLDERFRCRKVGAAIDVVAGCGARVGRAWSKNGSGTWEVKGDPTEGALVVVAAKAGLNKPALDAQFSRISEIPFTAETKRMTTLHQTPGGVVAYAKGAPEVIVQSCASQLTETGVEPLDDARRAEVLSARGRWRAKRCAFWRWLINRRRR